MLKSWIAYACHLQNPCRQLAGPYNVGWSLIQFLCAGTVGDIHGDLQKAVTSLKVSGVLEEDMNGRPLWCGGNTVVVQLGDVLDRGDCEIGETISLSRLDLSL